MTKENTNEIKDKPRMVNIGVKVSPQVHTHLEAIAKQEHRKLVEFAKK